MGNSLTYLPTRRQEEVKDAMESGIERWRKQRWGIHRLDEEENRKLWEEIQEHEKLQMNKRREENQPKINFTVQSEVHFLPYHVLLQQARDNQTHLFTSAETTILSSYSSLPSVTLEDPVNRENLDVPYLNERTPPESHASPDSGYDEGDDVLLESDVTSDDVVEEDEECLMAEFDTLFKDVSRRVTVLLRRVS